MFSSILCPLDFSKGSERALDVAVAWAEQQKSALTLVHVLEPAVYTFPGDLTGLATDLYGSLFGELEALMSKRVAKVRERVPKATGVVVRGIPQREIVERASAAHADLIVMATSGHGAVARAILGSVADSVLRSCKTPVLLVPEDARPTSILPKVIALPTDFSLAAQAAVTRTVALALELGASVQLVHAFEVPAYVERDPRLAAGLRQAVLTELHQAHHASTSDPSVRTHAREGAPAKTIVAVAEETRADLIALASTGRGLASSLLGGVTDRVVRMSHVPVLVFRSAS